MLPCHGWSSGDHHEGSMLFTVLLDNLDTQVLYILLMSII